MYFFLANIPGNSLNVGGKVIFPDNEGFVNSLYFSFITATSLGYGDVVPIGISKFLAGFEVIIGLIVYGVLISKLVGVKQEVLLEEVYNISYEEIIDRLRSGLYLFRSDINRNLVCCAANTPGFNFHNRRHILHRVFKYFQSAAACTLFYQIKRIVNKPSGNTLLAVFHYIIDESLHINTVKTYVRGDFPFFRFTPSHLASPTEPDPWGAWSHTLSDPACDR